MAPFSRVNRTEGSLVGRRKHLGLHELHVFAADLQFAIAGLDNQQFDSGLFIFVTLAELYCHDGLLSRLYFLSSSGVPPQVISASPPLVTMNSEPHVGHTYRFPV